MSYGQTSHQDGLPAKATFRSDSCRSHSTSSAGVRSGQIGSPIPEPPAGRRVPGHELAPGRDDAGRVRPHLGHVCEPDPVGRAVELLAQQADLRRVDDDERRLLGLDRVAEKRGGAADEVVPTGVEERFVAERHCALLTQHAPCSCT